MLEAVATPPTKPAAHAAQASSARNPERDEGGFQGKLREALVQPAEGDRAQITAAGAAPSAPTNENKSNVDIAKAPEGLTGSDTPGLSLPAEAAPLALPNPAMPDTAAQLALPVTDSPFAPPQSEQATTALASSLDQTAAFSDNMSAMPGVPPLAGVDDAAQATLGQAKQTLPAVPPTNGSGTTAPPVQAEKADVMALGGQAADVPSAVTPPAAQPVQGAQAQAEDTAPSSQAVVAQAVVAKETRTKDELPPTQALQDTLANALAAGPVQAAAGLAAPKPQAASGAPKPSPITPAEAALAATRPSEAASRLAQAFNATETAKELKLAVASETAEVSLQLTSLEAPKAIAAKPSGEARAEALPMATQGFAPGDGMAQRTEAPSPSANARELPAPLPARQLAPVVVSLALGSRDEALTIALDPVELGRVEVSIGQGKEAGQVRIVAERPETLALLQRDQRELDRALNQSGLGDMARSLSFSLASDQQRQQYQGSPQRGGQRAFLTISGVEADRAMPTLPSPLRNPNALVDIAV